MKSYSQYGEDSWILKYLPLPTQGVFVEVGAYDGVSSSNTKAFEEEGWTGLCVEPDPDMAALCRANRTARTICAAMGDGPALQTFHVNTADRGQSGLRRKPTGDSRQVPVFALGYTLFNLGFFHVDLLSIDTEGSELEVWSTRGSYSPPIVIMEFLTRGNPPRDKEIVDRMTRDRYREVHRTEANLIFTYV